MIDERIRPAGGDRRRLWCGSIALAAAAATWITVPTTLGVKVPETAISGFDQTSIDLTGHERIWRVWWRARDKFIDVHPQWIVTAGLIVLLAIFALGVLAAIWIALSPETEPAEVTE